MIVLVDTHIKSQFYPFTLTRHTAELRIGILTIKEKWEALTNQKVSLNEQDDGIKVPANIIPNILNFQKILDAAESEETIVAGGDLIMLNHPWHLFQYNDVALKHDFILLTKNKISEPISSTNTIINSSHIFIAPGATVEYCSLNASNGPIYIDANATVMEGSFIRGSFYAGTNSIVKMGTKIYGATSIGANCTIGGEIKNSILLANSNKAHDGYLGDSVLGEWCNLGAGTSNSNVKNTGGNVGYKLATNEPLIYAGNKAGLLMGDYSRAAINTSFNTGSVVGVCCNIFGSAMPPKYTPNFTWGNEKYDFDKALKDIENWKQMKGQTLQNDEIIQLKKIYTLP
ncbi:putative sugar nucleotidyl transferase [Ferruginibacter yonginensis]|uniref:Sugar nucleotidyl transferase n=1 Tax=Ferruginibacter yonginensis TaxID=1310416 RepID=A0ABV8QQW3_9BACT